jgi:hypothetical protein
MAEERTNDAPAPAEDAALANDAPAEVALLPAEDTALAPVAPSAVAEPEPVPEPVPAPEPEPVPVPAPAPAPAPAEPVSPAKEWGAAIVLMIVFALMCASFLSYFRGG